MSWTIATRGSVLARWQAEHVAEHLRRARPHIDVDVRIVHTTGDADRTTPMSRMGAVGLFTKEVDRALLDGHARIAVHSLKDLPTEPQPGLRIAAVLAREDPRDAWVPAPGGAAELLTAKPGSRIGTSSLRRRALVLAHRPDLRVEEIRGNLDTRLSRVAAADYDGIIVAKAGLARLGRADAIGQILEPPVWLPAAGQGALAVIVRDDDEEAFEEVSSIDEPVTHAATAAERAFLRELQGGCQIPIGALASITGARLELHGLVAGLNGEDMLRGQLVGAMSEAPDIGRELARNLISAGADQIIRRARAAAPVSKASAP